MNNNIDYSFSKSFQSLETIKKMYEHAFKKCSNNLDIILLDGGMKCAVYKIFDGTKSIVLKVSSTNQNLLLSYERNTMWWEVEMLKIMQSYDIPSPKLLYYDKSKEICEAEYFFMSYIEGNKLSEYKGKLNKEVRDLIEQEIGEICHKISMIQSNNFFLPSYKNNNFPNNYEFIKNLFMSLILDANSKNIIIPNYNYNDFINILNYFKEELINIKKICLVHSDMWDGNIIIKDEKVNGIVDFADLYFCDELFSFYFHTLSKEISYSFMKGYGKNNLTYEENIRIIIYKIFVIFKMIVEKDYKNFNSNGKNFDWLYDKLDYEFKKLSLYKK